MSKIETKQITLVSENGLVEKTLSIDNSGVVRIDGIEQAGIVSGTWTPELVGVSANPSVTYSSRYGSYTKIGRLVICHVYINATIGSGGSGSLLFTLPFIARNSDLTYAHSKIGYCAEISTIKASGISPINNDNKSAIYTGADSNINAVANTTGSIVFATMFSYFTD